MKKLFIIIPCLNEEETLPVVLDELPRDIPGVDSVEVLVLDDGSHDATVEVARALNVDHIISNVGNKGLGVSFRRATDFAIEKGADIVVNTDGDNQYPGRYIPDLIKPILEGNAEIVVGDRQTSKISHFSPAKRFFQWLGTKLTILLSGDRMVKDAVSGFRAYSREALLQLNITSGFSYILDTTVQSANKRLKTVAIPIETNAPTRPSRLFGNMWEHMWKSGKLLLRVFAMYKPLRIFFGLGIFFLILGLIPLGRFLYSFFLLGKGNGMIQSLIIGGILISISVNMFALGVIGDLMSKNRSLIEQILYKQKQ